MNSKRGVTLAELCVVMAVIGIVGASVTSFCVLIGADTGRMSETNRIRSDFELTRIALDRFILEYDSEEYSFVRGSDGSLTVKRENAVAASLRFSPEDKAIKGNLRNGAVLSYPMYSVTGAEFFVTRGKCGNVLVRCRVTYGKTLSATGGKIQRDEDFFGAVRAAS